MEGSHALRPLWILNWMGAVELMLGTVRAGGRVLDGVPRPSVLYCDGTMTDRLRDTIQEVPPSSYLLVASPAHLE